jgi:predicted AAA+ superfamily ATPase
LENLVCNHLLVCGYTVSIGRNEDKEIDFIAEKSGGRMYIQLATTIIEPQLKNESLVICWLSKIIILK